MRIRRCHCIQAKKRSTSQRRSSGLTFGDLAWPACFGCPDAVRSSRCRLGATPRPGDRCRRRSHRSSSPAWLRSCRSRNIAAPGGLRDGWPHGGNPWRSTIAMIFMPFPRFVAPISAPPPLAITNVASMKHSSSSNAPLSRSPMYRFVVGIALRQHMPLRTCVEKPQDCFKNATCRDLPQF